MLLVKIQWHSNIVGNKKADKWDYLDFGLTITEFWTCLVPSLRLAVSEEFVQPEILTHVEERTKWPYMVDFFRL